MTKMEGLDLSLPISLYVHIPFCKKKCDYCAFYSKSPKDEQEIEKYVSILEKEIAAVVKEVGKPFYTIFFGGGTPGFLGVENLKRLLKVAETYGVPEEVTIETNPEFVSEDLLELKPYVNRISVGIQSLHENVLKSLGRNSTVEKNLKALEILSRLGWNWNADIITAVPGESIEDTLEDIRKIASFQPDHISFYCLTFEEGTPLLAREKPLGDLLEADFLEAGWAQLRKLGYEHYEISNFAKPGKQSKHNNVYWALGQYIGVGPTAESSLGFSKTVSMRNTESLEDFFQKTEFTCERLNEIETEESYLLTALRVSSGIDKESYQKRFLKDFDETYEEMISMLDSSWYLNSSSNFCLTEKGMLHLDGVILQLAMAI